MHRRSDHVVSMEQGLRQFYEFEAPEIGDTTIAMLEYERAMHLMRHQAVHPLVVAPGAKFRSITGRTLTAGDSVDVAKDLGRKPDRFAIGRRLADLCALNVLLQIGPDQAAANWRRRSEVCPFVGAGKWAKAGPMPRQCTPPRPARANPETGQIIPAAEGDPDGEKWAAEYMRRGLIAPNPAFDKKASPNDPVPWTGPEAA